MSNSRFRLQKMFVAFIVISTLMLMLLEIMSAFGIAIPVLRMVQVICLASLIISVITYCVTCCYFGREEENKESKENGSDNQESPLSRVSFDSKQYGINSPFRGLVRFFTAPSEKLRAVRELRKAVESIYELEGKHQTDMSGFARLRICYNQDQHFLNAELKNVRDNLMSQIKTLKTSSIVVQAKKYEISSKFNELEDAEEKLQMLQNELKRHELPDIQLDTLTTLNMIELTKQIHDDHMAREVIHNDIIKAAAEILNIRIKQYSAAQTFINKNKSIRNI